MDKKVYKAVMERASGECEVCKRYYGDSLELHHILRRKVPENQDNCIALCPECHRGTNGVHGMYGHRLDMELKRKVQEAYIDMGYNADEVRELLGGRLYE
jgi:Zn finger protein HypA/HybF involved in hydrogenase expression